MCNLLSVRTCLDLQRLEFLDQSDDNYWLCSAFAFLNLPKQKVLHDFEKMAKMLNYLMSEFETYTMCLRSWLGVGDDAFLQELVSFSALRTVSELQILCVALKVSGLMDDKPHQVNFLQ